MTKLSIPINNIALTVGGVNTATYFSIQSGLLFCGALAMLSFFVVFIFLKSKDRIYLYYFLFLLFSLLEAAVYIRHTELIGTLFQGSATAAAQNIELVTLLAYSAYCLFTVRLLDIKSQNKKLFYWIVLMAFSGALYGIIYYFIRPSSSEGRLYAFIYSRLVILSMSIVAILWVFIKKIKSEVIGYFLIGSGFYFLGALLAVFRGTISNIPFPEFYQYNAEIYFHGGIFLEIICFTLALSVRIYISYEERQQKQIKRSALAIYEKEIVQAEALTLRIQINPHFLFNHLNVLKYYIQINQNRDAIQYLVKFSQFIRKIIDSNQKPTVSLEQELDIIAHYLNLEEIRFKQNLTYHFKIDKNVDIGSIRIPPMLLQPFIEEILWNGMQEDDNTSKREIHLAIHQSDSLITIVIEEDPGSDKQKNTKEKKFHKELNKEITAERIALFNKHFGGEISFHTLNDEELKIKNKGSQSIIKIKHKKNHNIGVVY